MARFYISVGIGYEDHDIETDDAAYAAHVMKHYQKQGLSPIMSDEEEGPDDFDMDNGYVMDCSEG